jgi:protoporphyrinogen/coproporphyrinogen III oxidase
MLLNYIGGAQDTAIANLTPDEIVQQVHADVKKILLKPDAPDPIVLGVRVWPRAIPQYDKGHLEILKDLEDGCKRWKGLYLGGNYKTGVAFGDCVQYGADVAKEVSDYLSSVDSKAEDLLAVKPAVAEKASVSS